MITTLMGFLTALSIGLVGAGGFYLGSGYFIPGVIMVAVGAGWNSILYSSILRDVQVEHVHTYPRPQFYTTGSVLITGSTGPTGAPNYDVGPTGAGGPRGLGGDNEDW